MGVRSDNRNFGIIGVLENTGSAVISTVDYICSVLLLNVYINHHKFESHQFIRIFYFNNKCQGYNLNIGRISLVFSSICIKKQERHLNSTKAPPRPYTSKIQFLHPEDDLDQHQN